MILFVLAAVMFVLSVVLSIKTPTLKDDRDPEYFEKAPIMQESIQSETVSGPFASAPDCRY